MAVTQQQSPSNAKWIAAAAPVAGIVITWFGFPGFAATLVLLVAAGYSAHPALFTGKKDSRGYPTPAHAGERREMQRYRMWQELRAWPVIEAVFTLPIFVLLLSLTYFASAMMVVLGTRPSAQQWQKAVTWAKEHTLPLQGSDSLLIGTRLWSFAAAGLALAFLSFPLERADAWRWVNTVSLYISIMQVNGAMRHNASEHRPSPGANLKGVLAPERRRQTGGAIIGGLVAAVAVCLATIVVIRKAQVAYLIWPAVPWQSAACLALAAGASVVALAVRNDSLAEWREFVRVAEEWLPRWETMKMDGAPRLIDHKTVGMATVDTFTAPPMPGALGIMAMVPQLQQVMGIPVTIAGLASPNLDTQGQDMPGTRHPSKLRIATWPNDQVPNLADPTTEKDVVDLWVESSLSLFCESTGYGRTALLSCDPVFETPESQMPTTPDEDENSFDEGDEPGMDLAEFDADMAAETRTTTAAYAVTISMPEGGDALGSLLRPVVGQIAGFMQTEVTIDHRSRVMFVGSLTEGTTNFVPPSLEQDIDNMTNEDLWNKRWSEILKKDANPPRPEAGAHTTVTLADRATITRESFVVRHGEDPLEFFKLESKIATALDGARFVSVTGFTVAGNRPGERHPLGFSVAYSIDSVAPNPDQLTPVPGNGPKFVLAGRINEAFDECRFARPEVAAVRALTDLKSRGHIWEIRLRLYGGVTLADVRTKAEKIRQHLGSAWLRVDAAADGCSIFAGANPETVTFDSGRSSRGTARVGLRGRDSSRGPAENSDGEKKNRDTIIRLDWEQAFLDAGVVTVAGLLPTLAKAGVLPNNEQVKDLEFDLPSGLDRGRVKMALPKLQASTGNAFVEVRPSSSASKFRLLAAVDSPLPRQAAYNFEIAEETAALGGVSFATGVEGTPVVFNPKRDPHILVAGATGGGKSVILQNLLYAALISGADVYVMDPTKGGADFSFAEPYTKAFCGTVKESAAAIKAIYQRVLARKDLNKQHAVGSYRDLPEEVRPNHMYVFIDEFTSLMQPDPVDKTPSDDPEVEAERQEGLDLNSARRYIGTITGKIAREARSAGVTLVLATQKLSAKMLDDIPGAGDLKDLTLDTRLPVPVSPRFPSGWATNGELIVGDLLYTPEGKTTPVLGFSEVFTENEVYAVTLDDGQVIKAGAGHLWSASDADMRRTQFRAPSGRAERISRARKLAAKTSVGTLASAAELAQLTGYLATETIVRLAEQFNTPRLVRDRMSGEARPYARTARRGVAPRLFHVGQALAAISQSSHSHRFAIATLEEPPSEWMTARELAELLAAAAPVSASHAGNVGTIFDRANVANRSQVHEPFLYDAHAFLTALAADDVQASTSRVVTTEHMASTLVAGAGKSNWAIRVASSINADDADLPVDPYVLGAWLGDGSRSTGIITSSSAASCTDKDGVTDQAHLIRHLAAAGYEPRVLPSSDILVGTLGLKVDLRQAGVLDDKRIPASYLRASHAQRLALLQGLMDTYGTVSATGQLVIGQTNVRLAHDIGELIQSLGIKVHTSERDAWYLENGHRKVTGRFHSAAFRSVMPVFRLPRKLAKQPKLTAGTSTAWRYVRSIERIATEPTQCIGVADPGHLFLVEGFVPTHNTNLARALMGNATFGERQSALKNPMEAPPLGDEVPPGRGLWESTSGYAELIQVWFEGSQDVFAAHLAELLEPLGSSDKLAIAVAPPTAAAASSVTDVFGDTRAEEDEVVDLGEVTFSLDDLEVDADDDEDLSWLRPAEPAAETKKEPPSTHAAGSAGRSETPEVPTAAEPLPATPSVLDATTIRFRTVDGVSTVSLTDPGTADYGSWKLDAIAAWLVYADGIEKAAWIDPDADRIDSVGIPLAETARDLFADVFVDVLIAPDATAADLDAFFAIAAPARTPSQPSRPAARDEDVFAATPPLQKVRPLLVSEDEF